MASRRLLHYNVQKIKCCFWLNYRGCFAWLAHILSPMSPQVYYHLKSDHDENDQSPHSSLVTTCLPSREPDGHTCTPQQRAVTCPAEAGTALIRGASKFGSSLGVRVSVFSESRGLFMLISYCSNSLTDLSSFNSGQYEAKIDPERGTSIAPCRFVPSTSACLVCLDIINTTHTCFD